MRQLVLLVCMTGTAALLSPSPAAGPLLRSWEAPSGAVGFYPVSNELSFYQNVDDAGTNRGRTLQVVAINSIRLLTDFTFEVTGDFNWRYSFVDPFDQSLGKNNYDYYLELSLVKPVTSFLSVNVQRVSASFESKPINQVGIRLSL